MRRNARQALQGPVARVGGAPLAGLKVIHPLLIARLGLASLHALPGRNERRIQAVRPLVVTRGIDQRVFEASEVAQDALVIGVQASLAPPYISDVNAESRLGLVDARNQRVVGGVVFGTVVGGIAQGHKVKTGGTAGRSDKGATQHHCQVDPNRGL